MKVVERGASFKFRSGVVRSFGSESHPTVGASIIRRFAVASNLDHVILLPCLSVKDALLKYGADPNVEYAEPNYLGQAAVTNQNDSLSLQQWALRNTRQFDHWTRDDDIEAINAWDIT